MNGIQVKPGVFMRLEDYCNSTALGSELLYTSGVVLGEEELLGIECGWRVANYVMEGAVDGWDALLDLSLRETEEALKAARRGETE